MARCWWPRSRNDVGFPTATVTTRIATRRKKTRRVSAFCLWRSWSGPKGFEPSTPTLGNVLQGSSPHVSRISCAVGFQPFDFLRKSGAGEGIRTLDPNLGKVHIGLRHAIRRLATTRWLLYNPAITVSSARTPYPTTASRPISSAYRVLTFRPRRDIVSRIAVGGERYEQADQARR
jgi:hypothetical protein